MSHVQLSRMRAKSQESFFAFCSGGYGRLCKKTDAIGEKKQEESQKHKAALAYKYKLNRF